MADESIKTKYSPIAQSVERVTVNHDVVGSSPTWGARKKRIPYGVRFLLLLIMQQVGREQGGDWTTGNITMLEVATNNLNGCWLARGCLLQRVQLGEPKRRAGLMTCFFFLFLN